MYASSTWLGAKSVCFVGNGGTLEFTRSDGQGLKIPQSVMNIQGLNGAKITVTGFSYNSSTNKAALWYETQPDSDAGYWIDGLNVECIGYGFYCCTQLTNCTGFGFTECTQLTNCTSAATGNAFIGCTQLTNCTGDGFYCCTQLTNCIGTAFTECTQLSKCIGTGYGFHGCTQLTNCISDDADVAFYYCTQLTNCIGDGSDAAFADCTQLTNCTGTGTGTGPSYGFYNCSWVNGCKQGETPSTTALFYNCSNVDPFTCEDQLNNGVTGQVLTKTEDGQEWADSAGGGAFDLVIRTQAEFEAMYSSSTWLGAKSVCFVGDGGTTAFTRSDGLGLKIPATVMNLQGLNGAKIQVSNLAYDYTDEATRSALFYEETPALDGGYNIDGLHITCQGNYDTYLGFSQCVNLTNCTSCATGSGFYGCIHLVNCLGIGNESTFAYGFSNCTRLVNCEGIGNSPIDTGYGFSGCEQLTNCTGTGLGPGYSYSFYNCSWVNGCKQGETPSTTAFTGGTMLHVDKATVVAS